MFFGLKNAGATKQCLVNKIFKDQIIKSIEVYMDSMIIESIQATNHTEDLQNTFELLKKYKMRLNPEKCAFGVMSVKFLEFMMQ